MTSRVRFPFGHKAFFLRFGIRSCLAISHKQILKMPFNDDIIVHFGLPGNTATNRGLFYPSLFTVRWWISWRIAKYKLWLKDTSPGLSNITFVKLCYSREKVSDWYQSLGNLLSLNLNSVFACFCFAIILGIQGRSTCQSDSSTGFVQSQGTSQWTARHSCKNRR